MATSKKKTTKTKAPAKRRGSAPKTTRRLPAEQLEVKGTERPRIAVLERLDKEFVAANSDKKAAAELAKAKAKRIADELRKLPDEYGGKYRTDEGRLLTVDVRDIVKSRPTKKPKRGRKNADPTPAVLPN